MATKTKRAASGVALGARVHSANEFMRSGDSGGRWAGERLLAAIQAGRRLTPAELRTNATLPTDAWIAFDDVAIREGTIRSPLFAEVTAAGLTIPIPNALGKTMFQWDKVTDMEGASVSLDGLARTDNDRVEFEVGNVPLPITHKDFNIGLRTLSASRESGEPLDTLQAGIAGRLVGEALGGMLINGHAKKFGGASIYGLLTEPNRDGGNFGTNGNWSQYPTKTGDNILQDTKTAVAALRANRFPGPYWLVGPSAYADIVDNDYKANGDQTIAERMLKIDGLQRLIWDDQMPADNVVVFQATRDVVAIGNGEGIQTIQWDLYGGMAVAFKIFAIQVPIVRSTESGRSGIYHIVAP